MAWDSATADNLSRRSAAQSDVAPRSVNRRVLRSDDALFTYDDDYITPVGDRTVIGPTGVTNTVRITGEYQFTEGNELDYSASLTDGMAATTITFTELPTNTKAIWVYVYLADDGNFPYIQYERSSGGSSDFVIGSTFADGGTNRHTGQFWIPTSGNTLRIEAVQAFTTRVFKLIGYKVGE